MSRNIGLYIHIPICRSKCYYCDFSSYPLNRFTEKDLDLYVLALEYELKHLASLGLASTELTSVYIGGGTPALIDPARLVLIMESVVRYFTLANSCELTIELNPSNCTPNLLRGLQKAGFNRYSLGVQSFNDPALLQLGRAHTGEEARAAAQFLRQEVSNLSLDLIYGLPNDSLARWQADLEEVLVLQPDHISLYSLQVEEGTPLARQVAAGLVEQVDDDLQASLWEWTCDRLYPTDYEHYEISNWALPGKESRHNLGYWLYTPYYGVGAGAAGFLGGQRYRNSSDPWFYTELMRKGKFTAKFPAAEEVERISKEQQVIGQIILALRTNRGLNTERIIGISAAEFWRRYGQKITEYCAMGLMWRNQQIVGLTETGMALSNRIFLTFMP